LIGTRDRTDTSFQAAELARQHVAGGQQRLGDYRQSWMARNQRTDPAREGARRCLAYLEPKAPQNAAQAHLDVVLLGLE
jgi:hypothetical protein